jgi:hypothetical protein
MKAWIVNDADNYYATVVFAETRNKAKVEALVTDCCEDMEYKDIRPRRFKEADEMYKGRREMDWYDPEDKRFMVKHGWWCEEPDQDECRRCDDRDVCEHWEERNK